MFPKLVEPGQMVCQKRLLPCRSETWHAVELPAVIGQLMMKVIGDFFESESPAGAASYGC
ncbi:MAG: hypothetical protein DRQ54_00650 [Gammaproteobacteria bacterium]|nr:MAG: hypothetical protein DRQ54_00650 [Gammaproteobacteria bacterium]RLA15851.1 MAG: hypothetical protein DRQ52_00795 [Gammaproteobacteria bacterium]